MSKVVDERVVEMRFDKDRFQSNVEDTISVLGRLKASLNLSGASKGLKDLSGAAKNVDMSPLRRSVESVKLEFSALQVAGVTAMVNLTNSAIRYGKRMASALTIDPIKTGFQEYETQINSVQTILANTSHAGTTLDQVSAALDELNTYADKTIYNFTEMTRNIGTFTAAGVDLDTSVKSIQGIANLAAVSGSTSQQASTVMYQLSQALAAGKVSLMDWNSVVNAGMGGKVFQDALIRTSELLKTGAKDAIATHGSFRESLSKGKWLTTEVLTKTLEQFTMAAEEGSEEWNKFKKSLMADGYTEQQAIEILKMANTATDAATKVKTFTQLWDTLQESAQSGWTQTWELIIGDFEEAKEFMTGLSDLFGGIINSFSEGRNNLLKNALSSNWDKLLEQINNAGISTDDFTEKLKTTAKEQGIAIDDLIEKHGSLAKAIQSGDIKSSVIIDTLKKFAGIAPEAGKATGDMTEKLEKFQKVVDEVWSGDHGNGEDRVKALAKAGYDYAKVQELVNKTVDGHKLTLDDLSDAQLKNIGYTDEQVKKIRQLAEQAEKTGTPINELINNLTRPSGRELLLDSFMNIINGIVKTLGTVRKAWNEIFPANPEGLYNLIAGFNKLTSHLIISDDTADKLTRTFKGVFAILDIIGTLVAGPVKFAIKTVANAFGAMDVDILSVTATVGDAIVKFRDFIDAVFNFDDIMEKHVIPVLKDGVKAFRDWIDSLKNAEDLPKAIADGIINGFKNIGRIFDTIFESIHSSISDGIDKIPDGIIDGLADGLTKGIKVACQVMIELGTRLLEAIKNKLGIHSPSTEFFEIGQNIIDGLINGLKAGAASVWEFIKGLGAGCVEIFKSIDFGKLFAAGLGIGMLYIVKKFVDVIETFSAPFDAFAEMLEGIGSMFDGIGAKFKAAAWEKRSKAILNFAIAIGVLAAALVVLGNLEWGQIGKGIVAIGGLAAIMVGLAFAMKMLNGIGADGKISAMPILIISGSLLLMAIALKKLESIDVDKLPGVIKSFAAIITGLVILIAALGILLNPATAAHMDRVGSMLKRMSAALGLMVLVIALAAKLKPEDVIKGIAVISMIELLFMAIIITTNLAGKYSSKAGTMLLKMSLAMLLMVGVVKLAAGLDPEEILKGVSVVNMIGLMFAALTMASNLAGKNAGKAGTMMLGMSIALAVAVGTIKMVSKLDDSEIERGIKVIGTLGILFGALIAVSHFAGENAVKAGGMLLLMSGALLVLTGVLFIISKMDPDGLYRAVGIVSVLEILFGGLIAVTHLAQDCKTTLILLLVAIGLLVGAVVGLTFIDQEKLRNVTLALSGVIIAFGLLIAATSLLKDVPGMYKTLLPLLGVTVILTGVVIALSKIDTKTALTNCIGLSILMLTFAGAIALISLAGHNANVAMGKMFAMLLVVGGLATILGLMDHFDVETSMTTVKALSILLLTMSGALVILNFVGAQALIGVGALALLGIVVGELAVILGLMQKYDINPSVEMAKSLSILLLSMSGALVLLGVVGLLGPAAFIGIGALGTLIVGIGGLVIGIGALMDKFPMLQEFLNNGIPVIEQIGSAIGSFFGNIAGGFLEGVTDGLPGIGTNLSNFMTNLKPFIEGAKGVDAETMQGVKAIAETILLLTAADIMESLTSWFTGGSSLSKFAKELMPFGKGMKDYAAVVAGIDSEAVKSSAEAAKGLAQVANAIPKSGDSVWASLSGEKNLSTFATQLVPFGKALKQYSQQVIGLDAEAVKNSAKAAQGLADVAKTIPPQGDSIWASITGEKNLADFGKQLVPFGKGMKQYAATVVGLDSKAISTSVSAAKAIVKVAKAIPTDDDSFWGVLSGKQGLDDFGKKITPFGKAMKTYSLSVIGINLESINNSVTGAKKILSFLKSIGDIDTSGVTSFKTALETLGKVSVKNFVNSFKEASNVNVKNIGGNMIDSITNGIKAKQNTLKTCGVGLVKMLVEAIKSELSKFETVGGNIATSMVKGMSDKKKSVEASAKSVANYAAAGLKGSYSTFQSAGAYLVSGFVNGISANMFKAKAKARAMAAAAAQAAEDELDIESPSKVGQEIGDFFGLGFVNGLNDYVVKSYDASADMANSARSGLSDAISKVKDILNSDMDTTPTIRPVLDLSEVRSEAGSISDMLAFSSSVGVLSGIRNIDPRASQNGYNVEVIQAINKLRKDLGNIGNTSYTINGITYDDGSNITSAVEALVRAAIIEGRV